MSLSLNYKKELSTYAYCSLLVDCPVLHGLISGIAYVQGMNEILGPIYYTFVTDSNDEDVKYAEADAFFCFTGRRKSFS